MVCKCGFEKKFREVLYTEEELKEVKLEEALRNKEKTWKDLEVILKSETKKAGYHWRWSVRCIEVLKNKKVSPNYAIEQLKRIKKNNKKLAALMHI